MAVDAQEELDVVWVRDGGFGDGVADREEGVEAFGNGPRETFSLGFVLGVAGGHVDGEAVAFFWVAEGLVVVLLVVGSGNWDGAVCFVYVLHTCYSVHGALLVVLMQVSDILSHDQTQLYFIM